MITDETGKALHDRASRGEKLSEEEKQKLESWYFQMDQMEFASIFSKGKKRAEREALLIDIMKEDEDSGLYDS